MQSLIGGQILPAQRANRSSDRGTVAPLGNQSNVAEVVRLLASHRGVRILTNSATEILNCFSFQG